MSEMSSGDVFGRVLDAMTKAETEEEVQKIGDGFVIGVSAGFLSRHTLTEIDPFDVTNMAMVRTRDAARDKTEQLVLESPELTRLETLRQGTGFLLAEYEEAIVQYPELEYDLEMVRQINHWANDPSEIDETLAGLILAYAGL
jgi:hypothetical protein